MTHVYKLIDLSDLDDNDILVLIEILIKILRNVPLPANLFLEHTQENGDCSWQLTKNPYKPN